jgi:uroporphyrinogen decarboxylase
MPNASRERVLRAFERKEPDRVPFDLGSKGSSLALKAYDELKKHLNVDLPTEVLDQRLGLAKIAEPILRQFNIDTRYVYFRASKSWEPKADPVNDTFIDEWGGTLKRPEGGFYYDHVDHPIKEANLEVIKRHQFPDPDDPSRYQGLKEEAKVFYDQGFAVGTYIKGVSETMWILRGIENVFVDMTLNQDFYHALAARTADVLARMVENFFAEVGDYVQYLCVTCDLGTQQNLMISPQTYKDFVRPYEKRIYDAVKKNSKAKVAHHSCGAIFKLIPLLIESGVDILNPVQTSANGMDTKALKREYGQDLSFWGGIDTQNILAGGTPEMVTAEVKRVMTDLGPGGLLLGPSHDIQAFTNPANVVALYQTALKFNKSR